MKTYYKVVRPVFKDKSSGVRIASGWTSCGGIHALNSVCVYYKLNVWSEPPMGKLFVFDCFDCVEIFNKNLNDVFECECVNPEYPSFCKIPSLYEGNNFIDILDFWKSCSVPDGYHCWPVPGGTVVCDAVKLIRRVR